eukprot:6464720-Alexandrium_andersonii.AAC.1
MRWPLLLQPGCARPLRPLPSALDRRARRLQLRPHQWERPRWRAQLAGVTPSHEQAGGSRPGTWLPVDHSSRRRS